MKAICISFVIVLTFIANINAQNVKLYELPEVQKAINKETRTRTGIPGIKYWQNYADYTLEALIDTSKNILAGTGTIVYHNKSPFTLRDLHIRLYQDIYKQGSARNFPSSLEDIHAGTNIDSLNINGKQYMLFNKPANQNIATGSALIYMFSYPIQLFRAVPV